MRQRGGERERIRQTETELTKIIGLFSTKIELLSKASWKIENDQNNKKLFLHLEKLF